jgi:dihydrofolate synthase/folylpolyglutamate synthase
VFTTYEKALHYLYKNLPIFQRVGTSAYRPDLTNTLALCEALGNPHTRFKTIHVAGTNGKGSSSHMLAAVLHSAGYKTGLYTSPHLKDFTERIKIDGEEVAEAFVIDFVNRIRPTLESIKPSFFEITVAMAFDYFSQQNVDVAVIEVGLGGRLDSTNVITPMVSLITNIGWDHTDLLGDTLTKIAVEKAGIIKPLIPVVISERQPEVEAVFIHQAKAMNAMLFFADDEFRVDERIGPRGIFFSGWKKGERFFENLELPLQGLYQKKNLKGILKVIDVLTTMGFKISRQQLLDGLINVVEKTKLKGRWQKLGDAPLIICDTGHNADGIREVVTQIRTYTYQTLRMVIGMVKDKDIGKILSVLPKEATYYFCQASIARALDADKLADRAREFGLYGTVVPNVNDALTKAKSEAAATDFIFIGGSTFVVAEIENL